MGPASPAPTGPRAARKPGSLRGQIRAAPDVDDSDDEIAGLMETGSVTPIEDEQELPLTAAIADVLQAGTGPVTAGTS